MRRVLLFCVFLSFLVPAFAQKNKQKIGIPQAVVTAQYVYVTSYNGDRFDRQTSMEDRRAIDAVERAIQAWGKYRLVTRPSDADIMLVVRPGEIAAARVGVDVPIGTGGGRIDTGRPKEPTVGVGAGFSNSPEDMLMVSLTAQEPANSVSFIWRRSQRNGLQGRNPTLVDEFRKAVQEAEPQNKKP